MYVQCIYLILLAELSLELPYLLQYKKRLNVALEYHRGVNIHSALMFNLANSLVWLGSRTVQ